MNTSNNITTNSMLGRTNQGFTYIPSVSYLRSQRKTLPLRILATLLFIFISACSKHEAPQQQVKTVANAKESIELSAAQATQARIECGNATRHDLFSSMKVSGVIDVPPQNLISISVAMGGYLSSTHLLPGMRVTKGQEIAVMEDQSYVQLQQDYLIAQSRVELLRKDFERQKSLNQNKSASDKTFEQVSSDFQTAQVTLRALSEKLRLINVNPDKLKAENISRSIRISSPISGYVSAVNVNIGAYVNASDVLFELVNPTDLHLALNVFEKDLPFVSVGQKVIAHLTADPARTFEAEVILVGKKLNDNRAATVHCHFHSTHQEMLPGMFVSAEIQTKKSMVLCVPEEAIVRSKDKEFLFIEVGTNQYRRVSVERGAVQDGVVEVLNDTNSLETKRIVVKNAWSLLMAMENTPE